MSLPVTNLDDRKFQDLVDEAKRMIPQLCPEWTNHNLSDPGVALIELFAWMTETMLFRLNQVPDVFYTRMFNLLGFDAYPASAARAALTFWVTGDQAVTVPAGTRVSTVGDVGEARIFTTLDDAVIQQPTLVGALTGRGDGSYVDVWEELSLGIESVVVFPGETMTPGDAFYLGFEDSLAGTVTKLDIDAAVEGIGVRPDRPPLVWEVWHGEAWIPVDIPALGTDGRPSDTTGGLNRRGELVLSIPGRHEPLTLGGARAYWLRAQLLPPLTDRPTYQTSPRVRSVAAATLGGTVVAEHSDIVHGETLGTSTGKPGQVFRVQHRPVLPRDSEERVEVVFDDEVQAWEEVASFIESSPSDRHYTWNSTTGEITFGPTIRAADGTTRQYGAMPREGAVIRVTTYRTGGGAAGNVGPGTLTGLQSSLARVAGVTNLLAATGGVDGERVDNAKLRGPMTLRAGGRAVTASDFERLTSEADSRVGRVRCLPPVETGGPIRLLVVPAISEPPEMLLLDHFALPDDIIDTVGTHLDDRRVLGSRIEIGTPFYQGVTIAALLVSHPGRPPALVQDRARRLLYEYVNPLTGGPDGTGWPFEYDLNAATVFQLLEAVEGVERVEEVLFFEYDLRNHRRVGFAKEFVRLAPDSLFLSANHQVVVR